MLIFRDLTVLLIGSLFFNSLYAKELQLSLDSQPDSLTCAHRHAIAHSFQGIDHFEEALKRINWDPCCLLRESLDRIDRRRDTDKPVSGLAFGATFGASAIIDRATYREMVLIFNGSDSFDLALVDTFEVGMSVSLPIAAGVTTSFLTGCDEVEDYLGIFITKTVAGVSAETGVTSLNPFKAKKTGCNSLMINDGTSTEVVGVSASEGRKSSPTINVSGAGAVKLIKFMTDSAMSREALNCN